MYVPVWVCVYNMYEWALWSQKMAVDTLELELQAAVSF